jgi:hypothetical protein
MRMVRRDNSDAIGRLALRAVSGGSGGCFGASGGCFRASGGWGLRPQTPNHWAFALLGESGGRGAVFMACGSGLVLETLSHMTLGVWGLRPQPPEAHIFQTSRV